MTDLSTIRRFQAEHGLNLVCLALLQKLALAGGSMDQSELARLNDYISITQVSICLDTLATRGFVARQTHSKDRRRNWYRLTIEGERITKQLLSLTGHTEAGRV